MVNELIKLLLKNKSCFYKFQGKHDEYFNNISI